MNRLDKLVAWVSPEAAVRRAQMRNVLAYYEAANATRLRKGKTAPGTGNVSVQRAGRTLRERARYYEQNHDLARGILADLVLKTVGPNGIAIEPQPRTGDGEIHDAFAADILDLYKDWCKRPEVTWQHDWASAQRMVARTWFRDGEGFAQMLLGRVPFLDHGTTVPLSLELMEPDICPLDYAADSIQQGIETNAWGRPRAYWVYKTPPSDIGTQMVTTADLKRIPAERMLHVKLVDRIRQLRGVSIFASVLDRLEDLKDYEESERIAAKVAASMAAVIKKGAPEDYSVDAAGDERDLKFVPGMVFDDLLPGESIETIDTKRPNANLLLYRQGQLRGAASGTTTSFSSIAKDYNGTYSAQRQELVESWSAYATCQAEFTSRFVCPTYESFVAIAVAAGVLKVPREVVPSSVDDAIYIGPQMPWIDPESEANANVTIEGALYESAPAIIRRRGGNPADVLKQQAAWERKVEKASLTRNLATNKAADPVQQQRTAARKGLT